MINKKSLKETAVNVANKKQAAIDANTKDVCDFLLKSFQSYANKGELECSLTCILKNGDKYRLQTQAEDTIDILNTDDVLAYLRDAGIKVSLTPSVRRNYQVLKASWE